MAIQIAATPLPITQEIPLSAAAVRKRVWQAGARGGWMTFVALQIESHDFLSHRCIAAKLDGMHVGPQATRNECRGRTADVALCRGYRCWN